MTDRPFQLVSPFAPAGDQPQAIAQLVDGLKNGLAQQTLLGVTGSGKTFTMANVIESLQRPDAGAGPQQDARGAALWRDSRVLPAQRGRVLRLLLRLLPARGVRAVDRHLHREGRVDQRSTSSRCGLSATKALLERRDVVIVATVSAIYGLGDPAAYHRMVLHLARGTRIDQRELLRRLAELQYTRNPLDLARGTYRVRGDVIDIFPAESERDAVRVELFDDEIEQISTFDPLTGEVEQTTPRVTIYPKTHYVTPRETLLASVDQIRVDLAKQLNELRDANKLVEAQRLEQRTRFDMEMIVEVGYCSGIENYSRYLSGRRPGEPPPCLFDYLPDDGLLFVDESHVTIPQIGGMYKGDRSRKETLVEYGFRLPSALDNRPLSFEEWEQIAPQTIFVSATPGPYERDACRTQVGGAGRAADRARRSRWSRSGRRGTQVDDVLSEINGRVALGERVLITTLTKRMAEDLTEYLHEHGVRVRYLHADVETVERMEIIRDLRLGEFDVLVGINLLREGLDMPEVSLVAILDADKEGFLRSEGSLIQTIGRAARNVRGMAILYADQVTGSMQRAIDETEPPAREAARVQRAARHRAARAFARRCRTSWKARARRAAELAASGARRPGGETRRGGYERLTPEQAVARIQQLEKRMYEHARDLEFEQAARLRDEINELRGQGLGFPKRAEEEPA